MLDESRSPRYSVKTFQTPRRARQTGRRCCCSSRDGRGTRVESIKTTSWTVSFSRGSKALKRIRVKVRVELGWVWGHKGQTFSGRGACKIICEK